jgi:hypothetical protein
VLLQVDLKASHIDRGYAACSQRQRGGHRISQAVEYLSNAVGVDRPRPGHRAAGHRVKPSTFHDANGQKKARRQIGLPFGILARPLANGRVAVIRGQAGRCGSRRYQ